MRRVVSLFAVLLAAGLTARTVVAQQLSGIPRVGFLHQNSPEWSSRADDDFREGMLSLGWIEGKTIAVDYRFAYGDPARLSANAADLEMAALGLLHRLPSAAQDRRHVEAGLLLSYGVNLSAMHRRLAYFVDKILKGARPADLPVEQPTKFEFVINLKAAKQIGLTIPPNVLARADRVIR